MRSTTLSPATTAPLSTDQPKTGRPADSGQPAIDRPTFSRPSQATGGTTRFACANCEMEIVQRPTFHVGLAFCCAGCVAGGPCMCSYDEDAPAVAAQPEPGWPVHDCLDVTALDDEYELAGRPG